MALEQADLDAIKEMISGIVDEKIKPQGQSKGDDGDGGDDDARAAAQKQLEKENAQRAHDTQIADSVKFNGTIATFVKENIDLFGGELGEKLLDILSSQTKNETEVGRANEYRKSLIDQFISSQKNLDVLTAAARGEVEKYKSLSQDEQRKQSAKFWNTIVDSGVEIQKQMKKARQIAIAKAGGVDEKKEVPRHIMVPKPKD